MKFAFGFIIITLNILGAQGPNLVHADRIREITILTRPGGHRKTVMLSSTERLPHAAGQARVEQKGSITEIDVEIRGMKPASLFGGDYNTYVLWIVAPDGQTANLGEFVLDSNRSGLHSTTNLMTFALLVTAEPHYLVSKPSAFVVLENRPNKHGVSVQYPVVEGIYNFKRADLDDVKEAKGKVHTEVKQAFTAFRLAERTRAREFAHEELLLAEHALDKTLHLLHAGMHANEIEAQARETVRLAVAARHLAEDRAFRTARVETEGSGGGSDEAGRHDPRGYPQVH